MVGVTESTYRERPSAAVLAADVVCTWTQRVAPGPGHHVQRVVPDGCIDVIWRDGRLEVAGPDTAPVLAVLTPGDTVVGVRFRPGHAPGYLGIAACELADARVALGELWGTDASRLADRLARAHDSDEAERILERAVAARAPSTSLLDPIADAAAQLLDGPDAARVADVAPRLGLSERQLHRRCTSAFGYGPKTLARILRFQRFIRAARRTPSASYARLAAECGYADEAHLARDCRALGGVTPGQLVPRRV